MACGWVGFSLSGSHACSSGEEERKPIHMIELQQERKKKLGWCVWIRTIFFALSENKKEEGLETHRNVPYFKEHQSKTPGQNKEEGIPSPREMILCTKQQLDEFP